MFWSDVNESVNTWRKYYFSDDDDDDDDDDDHDDDNDNNDDNDDADDDDDEFKTIYEKFPFLTCIIICNSPSPL
jgi:hypothetical protein